MPFSSKHLQTNLVRLGDRENWGNVLVYIYYFLDLFTQLLYFLFYLYFQLSTKNIISCLDYSHSILLLLVNVSHCLPTKSNTYNIDNNHEKENSFMCLVKDLIYIYRFNYSFFFTFMHNKNLDLTLPIAHGLGFFF